VVSDITPVTGHSFGSLYKLSDKLSPNCIFTFFVFLVNADACQNNLSLCRTYSEPNQLKTYP
jgi:hypothetical protein